MGRNFVCFTSNNNNINNNNNFLSHSIAVYIH